MKKIIALLLAVVMLLSLAACGSSAKPEETQAPDSSAAPAEAPAASPTATPAASPAPSPIVKPTITPTPTPAPTPTPTQKPITPPRITKDPTTESISEGENACFIADAENYNYITWFIVSPDHKYQYSTSEAYRYFKGLSVAGDNTNQLYLCNCPLSLDGWCVEAMFTGDGGRATTNHCYINVKPAPKTPLWASPSGGYYSFSDASIQLNADPGDTIYYELHLFDNEVQSGQIKSGQTIYIPGYNDRCYDAYLYAYVTTDKSNAISCSYTMDWYRAAPNPDPEPSRDYYPNGYFTDDNGDIVDINSDGYGSLSCKVSITGLSSFEGYGYYDGYDGYGYDGGVAFLTLLDPNGNYMYATFNGRILTVYDSSWSLLPSGTSFDGFI